MSLFIFFVAYFFFGFVWRSVLVYRHTGKNPFVLPATDDAHGYVGRAFKLTMLAVAALVTVNAFFPGVLNRVGVISHLKGSISTSIGWALLLVSVAWLGVAQAQMGNSWRIGIDTQSRTELVSTGLFSVSRNPIFLSVRASLLGLFLVLPNAVSLTILVAGELLVQVQVRLEEQHLSKLHGEAYLAYKAKVRRWI
jgi:protein-S-isoprenylcysteine O-methyltransferase Ste14